MIATVRRKETMWNNRWPHIVEKLDFALQPIINPFNGNVFAVEALLRNYESAGFITIDSLFDFAYNQNTLYELDLILRRKAIQKLVHLRSDLKNRGCTFSDSVMLFYNLDNRILEMANFRQGNTKQLLEQSGLNQYSVCYEISEKHKFNSYTNMRKMITVYKQQGFKVALDDFGVGFSGFELMYHSEPDYVKIDRHYISEINSTYKKKVYLTEMIRLAHSSGCLVIAEGVETRDEFLTSKNPGCDFIQGYFVAKPDVDVTKIGSNYDSIRAISRNEQKMEGDTLFK